MLKIFKYLGFTVISHDDADMLLKVPPFRVDIQDEIDLIEEIGRHFGYDRIPAHVPSAPVGREQDVSEGYEKIIKRIMNSSGFLEAINYSFMNTEILDALNIPSEDARRNYVRLLNPLSQEESSLRTFLTPSLLKNMIHNLNQGLRNIKIYEISRCFTDTKEKLPKEKTCLGALYLYAFGQRLWEDRIKTFYLLKGILEKIFYTFHAEDYSLRESICPFLHPGKSADIYIGNSKVGHIGILAPEIKLNLDLDHIKVDIGVLEVETSLFSEKLESLSYGQLPKFPSIQRDVALLVDSSFPAEEILSMIRSFSTDLIEDTWIFDLYEGKNIPKGKKSLGFSILYRSMERTLTEIEIEPLHQDIVTFLKEKTGGSLRS
jgi:phenylalanyl-tRNA synthetase beta chain